MNLGSIRPFEGNELLSFITPSANLSIWRRSTVIDFSLYMFNIREYDRHPCKRPAVIFMESVISGENCVLSNYTRHNVDNCPGANAIKNLKHIEVFSHKLEPDAEQMMAPH